MKVCHVTSGDLWAGAEMMCLRLLTGLKENKGVELSAILMNEGVLAHEIRKLGIQIEVVDETRMDFFRAAGRARRILENFRPDILHTHRLKENILGFVSSRIAHRGIPLICTQHGLNEPQSRLKWRLLSIANRYILSKHFRCIVTVSKDMSITLNRKFGISEEKLIVIPNGTKIPEPNKTHKRNQPFTIGSAGRLFPIKDFPFLVDIAAEVYGQVQDVRFELAGEGPEHGRMLEQIRKYGLQDVFCLKGFVEDMSDFYEGLAVYINTSLHEGSPMSVLEAMSYALPVVAPRERWMTELVADGVHGFLVEGRDPKRFAKKCLAIYRDRNLGRTMGAASRERIIKEYSVQSMADKYFDIYQKILS